MSIEPNNTPNPEEARVAPEALHALRIWGRIVHRPARTLAVHTPFRHVRRYGFALGLTETGVRVAWDDGSAGELSPSVVVEVPYGPTVVQPEARA